MIRRLLAPIAFLMLNLGLVIAERPLNFVLIMADDFNHPDGSVYGGQAATPNMEQLADEGMLFTKTFQSAPMCSPTRHALYTGLHPVRSGAWPNHTFVYDGVKSIAHYLQSNGYRAGLSGKTHINPPEAFPFEYLSGQVKNSNPDFSQVDKFLGECVAENQPFGLILASNEPHTPWNKGDASAYPPTKLELPPVLVDTPATREEYSRYLAEITYFDQQVGETIAALEKHGLAANTLLMVLTEQGNAFPFAKWTCYDVGLGSGMIIRWPSVIPAGSRSDALIDYIDILPTFFAAAGLPVPEGLDGRSFAALLRGQIKTHNDVVFGLQTTNGINNGSAHFGIRTARDDRYRYIRNLTPSVKFSNWATNPANSPSWAEWQQAAAAGDPEAVVAVRRYTIRPAEELYDCLTDPWNRHNLIDDPAFAAVKSKLSTQLDHWMAAQGDLGQPTELAAPQRLWNTYQQVKRTP